MGIFSDFSVGEGSAGEFEALPPGEYVGIVDSVEEVANSAQAKDPNGSYLNVKFQIVDGEYKGRFIFDKWTYKNVNEVAANIGKGKVTLLAKALGYAEGAKIDETAVLNKAVVAVVDVREGNNGYAAQNVIKSFKPRVKGAPAKTTVVTKAAPKQSVAAAVEEAWDE